MHWILVSIIVAGLLTRSIRGSYISQKFISYMKRRAYSRQPRSISSRVVFYASILIFGVIASYVVFDYQIRHTINEYESNGIKLIKNISFGQECEYRILSFITTTCPYCHKFLNDISKVNISNKCIKIMVIDEENISRIKRSDDLSEFIISYDQDLRIKLNVNYVPSFVFVDRNGLIQNKKYGYINIDSLINK